MPGAWDIAAIIVKALAYAGSLAGSGAVSFSWLFPPQSSDERSAVATFTVAMALLGGLGSVANVLAKSALLAGGDASGLIDRQLIGAILATNDGASLAVRAVGLIGVAAFAYQGGALRWIAAAGGLAVWMSFAMTGHTPERGVFVAGLLVVHLAAVSYWLGALWPLRRLCRDPDVERVAAIMKRFGDIAAFVVGSLIAAGAIVAWSLLLAPAALVESSYGRLLLGKLAAVALLLSLAALNKWRLVPALRSEGARAQAALRRSITVEMWLAGLILAVTATLTTMTGPPAG